MLISIDPPVHSYCSHGVDACKHRCHWEEVLEFTVGIPEVPVSMGSVDKVYQSVKSGHRRVRKGQVKQKVVGHRPHPLMGENDPYHDEVSKHGHRQHGAVSDRPESDAPRRLHELVGVIRCYIGSVVWRPHPPLLLSELS